MQHPTTTHSWDRLGVVPTLLDCSRPMKCHLIRVLHDGMQHSDKCIAKKTKRMEALHHLWILKHGTNKTEPWLAMMWIKIFQQFSSWWFQPTHLKKDESKLDHFHVHRDEHRSSRSGLMLWQIAWWSLAALSLCPATPAHSFLQNPPGRWVCFVYKKTLAMDGIYLKSAHQNGILRYIRLLYFYLESRINTFANEKYIQQVLSRTPKSREKWGDIITPAQPCGLHWSPLLGWTWIQRPSARWTPLVDFLLQGYETWPQNTNERRVFTKGNKGPWVFAFFWKEVGSWVW